MIRDRDGRPQTVHCFHVCTDRALVGDLLGVSRSVERDFLSVCTVVYFIGDSYYVISCNRFLRVCCVGLVVSTCQVIGWKDSPEDAS